VKLGNKQLVEKLSRSAIYRDYARAFSEATGMPLALRPAEHWSVPLHGVPNENPFCALMARSNRVCAACLEVQRKLTQRAGDHARTVVCFAGLSKSAVPIRIGDQLIGFLQTGQVLLKKPSKCGFDRAAKKLCLATVAKAVNTSTFYFCKLFKRATGLTFTQYLARVRIEKAKSLLLEPHRRINEVAYDVGFQSLTHFNRVFKEIVGRSPSSYRQGR